MLLPCAYYALSALTLSQQAYNFSSPMLESLAAVWAMLHFKTLSARRVYTDQAVLPVRIGGSDVWYFVRDHDQRQPREVSPLKLRALILMLVYGLIGHRALVYTYRRALGASSLLTLPLDSIRSCVDCNRRKVSTFKQPAITCTPLPPARYTCTFSIVKG